MIQRAYITQWRSTAPWSDNAQVEQDLILSRAIVAIFSDDVLRKHVAFRGGTALHKMFMAKPARYSEDLDLVQIKAGPIGCVLNALRRTLDFWLGQPQRKRGQGRVTLSYRIPSEIPPIVPLRLKVEINTREHFTVLGLQQQQFSVKSRWFAGTATVTTYALEELLGTKLRALYQRKKGRDLFDLAIILKEHPTANPQKIIECFLRYLAYDGLRISRAQFEANLAAKLKDSRFLADITPLLSNTVTCGFDVTRAVNQVQEILISRIPGQPWRGPVNESE